MTKQAQHTPAPWAVKRDKTIMHDAPNIVDENSAFITTVHGEAGQEHTPNANLIAAAPELLTELEKELAWLKHIKPQVTAPESVMMGFDQSIKYIEMTINKAKASK